MGVGRQQARLCVQAIKDALPGDAAGREAAFLEAWELMRDTWLKFKDRREAAAQGFAASRPGQFNSFVDALPDPPVDQTP